MKTKGLLGSVHRSDEIALLASFISIILPQEGVPCSHLNQCNYLSLCQIGFKIHCLLMRNKYNFPFIKITCLKDSDMKEHKRLPLTSIILMGLALGAGLDLNIVFFHFLQTSFSKLCLNVY